MPRTTEAGAFLAAALSEAAGLVADRLRRRAPDWPADDLTAELISLAGTAGSCAPSANAALRAVAGPATRRCAARLSESARMEMGD
jgi:hypothetical protein